MRFLWLCFKLLWAFQVLLLCGTHVLSLQVTVSPSTVAPGGTITVTLHPEAGDGTRFDFTIRDASGNQVPGLQPENGVTPATNPSRTVTIPANVKPGSGFFVLVTGGVSGKQAGGAKSNTFSVGNTSAGGSSGGSSGGGSSGGGNSGGGSSDGGNSGGGGGSTGGSSTGGGSSGGGSTGGGSSGGSTGSSTGGSGGSTGGGSTSSGSTGGESGGGSTGGGSTGGSTGGGSTGGGSTSGGTVGTGTGNTGNTGNTDKTSGNTGDAGSPTDTSGTGNSGSSNGSTNSNGNGSNNGFSPQNPTASPNSPSPTESSSPNGAAGGEMGTGTGTGVGTLQSSVDVGLASPTPSLSSPSSLSFSSASPSGTAISGSQGQGRSSAEAVSQVIHTTTFANGQTSVVTIPVLFSTSPIPSSSSSADPTGGTGGGLKPGAIAGIIVALILLLLIVLLLVCYYLYIRRRQRLALGEEWEKGYIPPNKRELPYTRQTSYYEEPQPVGSAASAVALVDANHNNFSHINDTTPAYVAQYASTTNHNHITSHEDAGRPSVGARISIGGRSRTSVGGRSRFASVDLNRHPYPDGAAVADDRSEVLPRYPMSEVSYQLDDEKDEEEERGANEGTGPYSGFSTMRMAELHEDRMRMRELIEVLKGRPGPGMA